VVGRIGRNAPGTIGVHVKEEEEYETREKVVWGKNTSRGKREGENKSKSLRI